MARRRGNAESFRRWKVRVAERMIPGRHRDLHAKIHLQLDSGLVADSPVGNPDLWESPPPPNYAGGRFKGNWQASIGSRPTGETGRIDPGGGETKAANATEIARLRPFSLSWEVNNVPYAARLNQNPPHTKQIPPGFVQRNLQRVRNQFRGPFKR